MKIRVQTTLASAAMAIALSTLPAAQGASHGQNPCNPCAAKINPCNPCNPCAAKLNPCNPCNPCAAKANPCNPCNPCAAKANPCNPCNPCAAKNPCNPCAAKNPCNPCAARAGVDPRRVTRPAGMQMAVGSTVDGKKLWNSTKLSTNGLSCATCHDGGKQFSATFAKPYPHYVAMADAQSGLKKVDLDEMVQFCMVVPMAADPLPWNSEALADLTAYTAKVQKAFIKTAATNPCNPCAARNPCNPCNPCAVKRNPCNPCAAKNPCNPCAVKNNPCGASG